MREFNTQTERAPSGALLHSFIAVSVFETPD